MNDFYHKKKMERITCEVCKIEMFKRDYFKHLGNKEHKRLSNERYKKIVSQSKNKGYVDLLGNKGSQH